MVEQTLFILIRNYLNFASAAIDVNEASISLPEVHVYVAPAMMQGRTLQMKVFYDFHIVMEQREFEV